MLYNALHHLWRLLPRQQRQEFFYRLTSRLAPRPGSVPPAASRLVDGPVTVAGLFSTTTGLGEGARLCLDAFQRLGFDTRAVDVSAAFNQADMPGRPPPTAPVPAPGEGGSLIVHINSPYLPFAFWHLGRGAVRGRRVIAYWAWELPRVPLSWRRGLPFVHEIWVPSRFTAAALASETSLPIRVVPHPLAPPVPAPVGRADFGLPETAFVTVAFFHMGSSFTRKNPLASIAAFRRAFGDDPNRILVLKVIDSDLAPWAQEQLRTAIAGASNIRVLDRRLTGEEVTALLALADAVLSLHRAEGFGLVPAQAMQLGKPVIATGWSGNLDFMNADNALLVGSRLVPAEDPQGTYDVPGQCWADPDPDEAAQHLRRLAADPVLAQTLGARAKEAAACSFSLDAYRAAIMAPLAD